MPKLKLYFAPDTCARVPLTALEQIGCDYDLEVIAFMKGEHRSSDYLRLNRSGKLPALPEARSDVFAKAETAMQMHFAALDGHLSRSQWWYGADWSIVDAYINWVWFRVSGTDFDTSPYPALARHDRDVQARPAVQRMLKRNAEVALSLEERGLAASFKDWRPPAN